MANASIFAAFERFWQHVVVALGDKADASDVQTQFDQLQHNIESMSHSQADWEQNDSTKMDFIKNRPFYETDPVEAVIAEGTIPAGGMLQTSASINSLTIGEIYNAVFDGVTYNNLVCEDYDGLPTIMNDVFMFAIQSGKAMAYAANGSTSHTLKVMALLSSIVPLDRKFIAEHIDTMAGEKVSGKSYTVDEEQVVAGKGAEVFNDYKNNIASGEYSHAEGMNNIASGSVSHAEGWSTVASGSYSHAEGYETTASESRSHAEGWVTEATGQAAHAEGFATHATGQFSHAEGDNAIASGRAAHAEGCVTEAIADYSHAEGLNTIASGEYQHVQGKYNAEDTTDTYAHIVGGGTSNSSRKNIHTVDWKGNAWFAGNIYVGGTSQDSGATILTDKNVIPVAQGGTGATDTANALKNIVAGNTGTSLPDAGNAGRMFFVPSSEVPFAPAGYGLGTYSAAKWISNISEIDNIKTNGVYGVSQNIGSPLVLEGIAFNMLNLEVYMVNALWGTQIVRFLDGYVMRRRCRNGAWEAWMWENPPMQEGVEYRTTELWNGKAVYKKLHKIGYLAAGTHNIAHNIGSISTALSIRVTNNNVEDVTLYSGITNLTFSQTNISIVCGNAFGNLVAELKYTK